MVTERRDSWVVERPEAFAQGEVQMFDLMIAGVFVAMVLSPCVFSVFDYPEEVAE
jgi:hypothetical protein